MIEQSVSLASNGVVKVPGYEQLVRFGYTKNRGVYRLAVTASGEWEGLTIRAFWHVPDGKDPASSLVVDGYVGVPASVTAQPGNGCVTFEGSDGTKTVTSADLRYRVSANSGTEDGTEPEPGTPAWQQLVDAVHTDATAAEQAKTDAQTAAQQAGASAKKAGQALSDTVGAKKDALKAIGDKQTAATQAVDTARDEALQQVEASTEAAQTAASEAATSADNADQSAQKAAGSLKELKDSIASGDFKGEPGVSPTVTVQDITGGHRIVITDATGTRSVDVLNGKQGDPGKPGDMGATPELTIGTVKEGDAPSATITGTAKNPVLNLTLKSGAPGKDATVDATLTHEGKAADAKATGDAISAVKVRQNILTGSETGNPIAVDDAFSAPLCGLTVYGRSTQDGTPSPDNPVPIVSAGDGGTITVALSDGNGKAQSLILLTPTGLPGIPVTSGGNYTDPQGQQWVCDEVDLAREVMVQRIKTDIVRTVAKSPTAKEGFVQLSIWLGNNSLGAGLGANAPTAFCNRALNVNQREEYNPDFVTICTYGHNESVQIRFNAPTALYATSEEFSAALIGAAYSYVLATPIETPLTPAEIAAYKALTAYGPDTVVQAGDGAGIRLEYQRDVNIAIKRIEDAVASMT